MGWGGVTVIWPADGQSDAEAIGAHFGTDVVLSENGDHLVEPTGVYGSTDKPDASWDEFLLLAEQRLRWRHPGSFRLTDPATDANGHLISVELTDELDQVVRLYPGSATVLPARRGGDEQFTRMWSYVTALADLRRSVVWEGDDDVLIDVTLTAQQARQAYLWV